MNRIKVIALLMIAVLAICSSAAATCYNYDGPELVKSSTTDRYVGGLILDNSDDNDLANYYPTYILINAKFDDLTDASKTILNAGPVSGTLTAYRYPGYETISTDVDYNIFKSSSTAVYFTFTFYECNYNFNTASTTYGMSFTSITSSGANDISDIQFTDTVTGIISNATQPSVFLSNGGNTTHYPMPQWGSTLQICSDYEPTPTPTPTPTPVPGNATSISVNLLEKYSNAALINQALTVTSVYDSTSQTKTSLYGETLHFTVLPNWTYYFTASRTGYEDYNETYTIPASPGIHNVYMERILTPIANKSYAHFSVVDQTNGGLIPNAAIVLSDGQSKLTNSAGYCYFSVNNSTAYTYTVSKTGYYVPASGAFNITADTSFLVALQRSTGPTPTWILPSWTPVTVPTTGDYNAVPTLSAALRKQNVQQGMDVWYEYLPSLSQLLLLVFIVGLLGLMAGGERRR